MCMTLSEAIKHCEHMAEIKDQEVYDCCGNLDIPATHSMKSCAAEHRQLAEWLKELEQLRSEKQ